jgi:hypothetical protein
MLSGLPSVACAPSARQMPVHGAVLHRRLLKRWAAVALQRYWSRFLRSRTVEISRMPRRRKPRAETVSRPATKKSALHQKRALTTPHLGTMVRPSTIERIGSSKISQSEVDWVISLAGQPVGQPDPKNPTALRGEVGVWNCESSDRIRGL